MITAGTANKLRTRLIELIDSTLDKRSAQIDFMIRLNHLDDILIAIKNRQPFESRLIDFLKQNSSWLNKNYLTPDQQKRVGRLLNDIHSQIEHSETPDAIKVTETVGEWLWKLTHHKNRLVLKKPAEKAPLSKAFVDLLARESEEFQAILSRNDHIMTCLNEILELAESKTDRIYVHLAASLIYYLRLEGYRVDPYIKRLRKINSGSEV